MKINKEKIKQILKKYLPFVLTGTVFLCIGILLGFYFNPKYGTFSEKTEYLIDGIRGLFQEEATEIVEVCEECDCPQCEEETEEEDSSEVDSCPIRVDISGAVKYSGVYCFEEGAVIMDAVTKAGGFLADYGYKYIYRKINLAQELEDNQKIYFPFEEDLICEMQSFSYEVEEAEVIISSGSSNVGDGDGSENVSDNNSADDSDCISINNATAEELMELSGVGESTAQKIIDGRPYDALEDLLDVSGIGDATFAKIEDDICL